MSAVGYRTGIARRIWLHIYREGGTWTVDELAEALGVARTSVNTACYRMADKDLLQHTKHGAKPKFGVTKDCAIPSGVTLAEVLA